MIEIRLYNPSEKLQWDRFVMESRNGTFLHLRGYMDYHADRFTDFSLIAADEKGRWITVLPACREGDTVISHAGLTFAGWIMGHLADAVSMLEVTVAMVDFLSGHGVKTLLYKAVPYIYTSYPAQEDVYALWRCGAVTERALIASAVDMDNAIPFDMAYRQDVRRAERNGVELTDDDGHWIVFWQLLKAHLQARFNAAPVHSLAEIQLLQSRFPENIRLYTAWKNGALLGGEVVYHSGNAAHSQYVALSAEGRKQRVLPALHKYAMDCSRTLGERYFDFGTSNEDGGHVLNSGLVRQKIASGARGVAYITYRLSMP